MAQHRHHSSSHVSSTHVPHTCQAAVLVMALLVTTDNCWLVAINTADSGSKQQVTLYTAHNTGGVQTLLSQSIQYIDARFDRGESGGRVC